MRSKVDQNHATLIGRVARAKAWPSNGRPFSSGSVGLIIGETTVPLKVFIETSEKRNDVKHFEEVFRPGALVVVTKALFTSYTPKPKEGKPKPQEQFQIDCKMNGSYRIRPGTPEKSVCMVSGEVVETDGEWVLLRSAYFAGGEGGRTGKIDHRRVWVLRGSSEDELQPFEHILALGSVGTGAKGPYLKAAVTIFAE